MLNATARVAAIGDGAPFRRGRDLAAWLGLVPRQCATGGKPIDESVYGVIPQVMPLWVSYTLYRFEANVRSASVVGMVGAGGIGMLLWDAIRGFDYGRTSAMVIVIELTVTLIDSVSGNIRKRFT